MTWDEDDGHPLILDCHAKLLTTPQVVSIVIRVVIGMDLSPHVAGVIQTAEAENQQSELRWPVRALAASMCAARDSGLGASTNASMRSGNEVKNGCPNSCIAEPSAHWWNGQVTGFRTGTDSGGSRRPQMQSPVLPQATATQCSGDDSAHVYGAGVSSDCTD